jgi:hypothetical protein
LKLCWFPDRWFEFDPAVGQLAAPLPIESGAPFGAMLPGP